MSPLLPSRPHDPLNFNNSEDQIRLINKKLGKLNDLDMSFINSQSTLNYVSKINEAVDGPPMNFMQELSHLSPNWQKLITHML